MSLQIKIPTTNQSNYNLNKTGSYSPVYNPAQKGKAAIYCRSLGKNINSLPYNNSTDKQKWSKVRNAVLGECTKLQKFIKEGSKENVNIGYITDIQKHIGMYKKDYNKLHATAAAARTRKYKSHRKQTRKMRKN